MLMLRALALACVVAGATAGCGGDDDGSSSIRVAVSTDLETPVRFDGLSIQVVRDSASLFALEAGYDEVTKLPNSYLIEQEPGLDEDTQNKTIAVTVAGLLGEEAVVKRTALLEFSDRAVLLRMPLCKSCLAVECTNGQTCKGGECVAPNVDAAALPADDGSAALTDAECPDAAPRCTGKCGEPGCGTCPAANAVDIGGQVQIDPTEVTVNAYNVFLDSNPHPPADAGEPECALATGYYPDKECLTDPSVCVGDACGSHPQVCVQHCAAASYCAWAGKRLCGDTGGAPLSIDAPEKQGEWYTACAGPSGNAYPYGPDYGNDICNDDGTSTLPVRSRPLCKGSSPDLYDMSGNAAEWENACTADSCNARGGSFGSFTLATCYYRFPYERAKGHPTVGFRCCQ